MTATRLPAVASAAVRFDVVTVLPVPPLGPSTQTIEPRPPVAAALALARRRATTFCSVKRTRSGDSGRRTTSSAPISKSRLRKPLGEDSDRTTIASSGCSRAVLPISESARSE
jgi:hypothetical protein